MVAGLGETRPTRWKVLALVLLAPLGLAHYYVGQRRRALVWFAGLHFALVAIATSLVTLGPGAAWPLCIAVLALGAGAWLLLVIDVLTISPERYVSVPTRTVILAGAAFFVASLIVRDGVRMLALESFSIPSGAMLPTLWSGDNVYVDKAEYGLALPFAGVRLAPRLPPARGDAIVFEYPRDNPADQPMDFVKRVVAVDGDTLEMDGGHPIINGWRVPSCLVGKYALDEAGVGSRDGELHVEFLGERPYLIWLEAASSDLGQGPYVVSPGEVWVLGDNRRNSSDSRAWRGGKGAGVPYANIKGRAFVVWMAFDESGVARWDRLGTNLLGAPRLPDDAPPELARGLERCLASRPGKTLPPARRQ